MKGFTDRDGGSKKRNFSRNLRCALNGLKPSEGLKTIIQNDTFLLDF